jgi:Pentapeptide repeats (8 copies)
LADSEHVEVLRRGPRSWNAWRRQNPNTVPNLVRLSLSAAERQMGTMNGGPVNLASARLRGASLRFATLSGANLSGADLSGADLTDARLDGANLTNADLSHALLNRTDFAGARLVGARLEGTNLALACNLTQDQIMESLGDAFTLLPHHLEPPVSWTEASAAEPQLDDGRSTPVPDVASRDRGGTMSWLVGGYGARSAENQIDPAARFRMWRALPHDVLLDLLLGQPRRGARLFGSQHVALGVGGFGGFRRFGGRGFR